MASHSWHLESFEEQFAMLYGGGALGLLSKEESQKHPMGRINVQGFVDEMALQ